MTPLFDKSQLDPFKQANFDELDNFTLDVSYFEGKQRKIKKRTRLPSSWYIVENELEDIIEEYDSQNFEEFDSQQFSDSQEDDQFFQQDELRSFEEEVHEGQHEKQSNSYFESSNYEFKCPEWQAPNPKQDLILKIKSILHDLDIASNKEKVLKIKAVFETFLCEYEKFYFEDALQNLQKQYLQIEKLVQILVQGVEQTFKRQIGGLLFQKRRLKLLRYLDKKKRRVWRKKVSYDCRKKVADGRLRIKGKFVTHEQACEQLGLASVQGYTPNQIKEMLYRKLDHS